MFRDQTEADLFTVKVPVWQGIDGATGANPSTDDPCGANRDGSEFAAYLQARRKRMAGTAHQREGTVNGAGRLDRGEDATDGVAGANPMRLAVSAPAVGRIAGVGDHEFSRPRSWRSPRRSSVRPPMRQ